jgi:AraC-like DNA-binding protein
MTSKSNIVQLGFKPAQEDQLGIELMSIEELKRRAPPEHFLRLQRADFFRLIGVLSGRTDIMVDFTTHPARQGSWLLIRPGQVMRYDFSRPWTGWMAALRPESVFTGPRGTSTDELDLVRQLEDMPCHSTLNPSQHAAVCSAFELMLADSQLTAGVEVRNELMRLQMASSLLHLSVWQSMGSAPQSPNSPTLTHFKRFRQTLELAFFRQHQVQHYADSLGLSEKSLTRACQAGSGMPTKAYIAQRLGLEAKRLLAHTVLPVQAIADQLGFDEATNFVKFFRKEVGVTPLAFRKQHNAPQP